MKNWIRYEAQTRNEVQVKVNAAKQLGVVPFIVARYIDRQMTNRIIYQEKGVVYEFKSLILPHDLNSLAEIARFLLGYHVIAIDGPTSDMKNKILDIHMRFLRSKRFSSGQFG